MERVVLNVSMGPHIHGGTRTSDIMTGYLVALAPAAIWGCCFYRLAGLRSLLLAAGSAVVFEWIARAIMKRPATIGDGSALVSGLLLGMMFPANAPWWLILIGTAIMVIVAKQFFGGIGYYPFNPVLLGYLIPAVSWPLHVNPHYTLANFQSQAVHLEPLAVLKSYGPQAVDAFNRMDLLMGRQMGGVGTGPILLLLLGGLYLMLRGYISWIVSISFLAGIFVFQGLFYAADPAKFADPVFHLISGTTVFGAIFLATDYTVCPVNKIARVIYGLGAALMTLLIRNLGNYADGTVFAVLIMNMFHPLIDRIKKPVYGLDSSIPAALNSGK
ncbi:RnfABCDGE type electron transport complex subunit D [bacterium]|nr:RnfABCDGE type electron transport complex subunit D [candidate division CSSED10-310 bacterium]